MSLFSARTTVAAFATAATVACASKTTTGEATTPPAASVPAKLPELTPQLDSVRTALDRFRDPIVAVREGYFSTVGCIAFPGGGSEGENMNYKPGAMGVHFLNPATIGPTLDPAKPQVLIYEYVGDSLKLTAAEWFMPVAVSKTAPVIFGKTLDGPMHGHPPILPDELHHWDLHVWLWKENPAGLFHPTNASVKCEPGPYTFNEAPPKMVHSSH
jgi:hypothetical protein